MAGSDDKQCRPLIQSASDVVVLSLDIAGKEVEKLPERIVQALESDDVQKAIKAALDKEALRLLKAQQPDKPTDAKQAETVLKNLGEAGLNAVSAEVRKQIENSPQVQKLQKEAKALLEDFKCSPVGIWVDEHKTLLYIVGGVLALGGAAALYFTKSGDSVANFAQGKGTTIHLGKISIEGKLVKFVPSTSTIGAAVNLSGKWKPLKADLALAGTVVGKEGTVSADGKVVVPLVGNLSAMSSARFDLGALPGSNDPRLRLFPSRPQTGWNQYRYQLAAGLTFDNNILSWELLGHLDNSKPSGSLKATYKLTAHDWRLDTGLGLNAGPGNFSGQWSVGIVSTRKSLPLELKAQADLDAHGKYTVQTNLVLKL